MSFHCITIYVLWYLPKPRSFSGYTNAFRLEASGGLEEMLSEIP